MVLYARVLHLILPTLIPGWQLACFSLLHPWCILYLELAGRGGTSTHIAGRRRTALGWMRSEWLDRILVSLSWIRDGKAALTDGFIRKAALADGSNRNGMGRARLVPVEIARGLEPYDNAEDANTPYVNHDVGAGARIGICGEQNHVLTAAESTNNDILIVNKCRYRASVPWLSLWIDEQE